MSSSSYSDEENTMEKSNSESQKKYGMELVDELKSCKVAQFSEEGSKMKKKLPDCKEYLNRPEKVKSTDYSKVFLPKFRTLDRRSTGEESASDSGVSNWIKPRTHHTIDNKEKYVSNSQSKGWRDPNFKYERCNTSSNWRNDDVRENRSRSFGYSTNDPLRYYHYFDRSRQGNWTLTCAPDIILENGLTEIEHVRNCIFELIEQNGELFTNSRLVEYKTMRGDSRFNCYTSNYEDKKHIAKVADILREKIEHYPYCMTYFHGKEPLYLSTCEKELYEIIGVKRKLVKFED